ncbi:MAG: class I SAM-dependent methyltransferase [Candidatus Thorarchaeota archaeon]|nr:class I SAM-dependent methyltransferase [Candidatus Thorarchaeota archaeon]
MTDQENIKVAAPEKWMDGWDNIYKQMLDASDADLRELEVSRPVRQFAHALNVSEADLANHHILELASGDGSTACYLGHLGCKVEGVEALANAVTIANRRIRMLDLQDKVSVRLGDIDGWDLGIETYDSIVIIQSLQYLFDRTIPRLEEILAAIRPGGFFVYSGNILPHFVTEPPIRFITRSELISHLDGWTLHCFGGDESIIKPGDLRGYIWTVARKPK